MMNSFKSSGEDIELRMRVLADRLNGIPPQAIIAACRRFEDGEVDGQSKRNAPTVPEFVQEARKQQEYIALRDRPKLVSVAPSSRGPSPFEIRQTKAWAENANRPVLHEGVGYDEFKKMSASRAIPAGSVWISCIGVVFGPEHKRAGE